MWVRECREAIRAGQTCGKGNIVRLLEQVRYVGRGIS